MFVKRRRNLNLNNNDLFQNLNYDKVPGGVAGEMTENNNGNRNGEVGIGYT